MECQSLSLTMLVPPQLPVCSLPGNDRCPPSLGGYFSAHRGTYFLRSVSQFVTKTTGAALSVMEFRTRKRPSRETS